MNQTTKEDELQKAIDDITKNSMGETATANLSLPNDEPDATNMNATPPAPDFGAPVNPSIPETPGAMPDMMSFQSNDTLNIPTPPETPIPMPEPSPIPQNQNNNYPPLPPTRNEDFDPSNITGPVVGPVESPVVEGFKSEIERVKKQALHDLAPLLEKMNINQDQKLRIYFDILESGDMSVLSMAYNSIKSLPDDNLRGEALLRIIDFIDKL